MWKIFLGLAMTVLYDYIAPINYRNTVCIEDIVETRKLLSYIHHVFSLMPYLLGLILHG